jgi:hypothetical protein
MFRSVTFAIQLMAEGPDYTQLKGASTAARPGRSLLSSPG